MPDPLKPCLFWCVPADRSVRAAHTTRVCRPALNSIRLGRDTPGGRAAQLARDEPSLFQTVKRSQCAAVYISWSRQWRNDYVNTCS